MCSFQFKNIMSKVLNSKKIIHLKRLKCSSYIKYKFPINLKTNFAIKFRHNRATISKYRLIIYLSFNIYFIVQ